MAFEVRTHARAEICIEFPDDFWDPTLILLPDSLTDDMMKSAIAEIRDILSNDKSLPLPEFFRRVGGAAGLRRDPDQQADSWAAVAGIGAP